MATDSMWHGSLEMGLLVEEGPSMEMQEELRYGRVARETTVKKKTCILLSKLSVLITSVIAL